MNCEACGYTWQEGGENVCPSCGAPLGGNAGDDLYNRGIAAEREGKFKTAAHLYADAADAGVPCAAYAVSRVLEKRGVRQSNPDLYEFWLFTAARQDPIATMAYAEYLARLGDESGAFRYLHLAAEMGHRGAVVKLGIHYMRHGNKPAARHYFARAKGSLRARICLFFLGRRKPAAAPIPPEMPDRSVEAYTIGMYAMKLGVPHIAYSYFEESAQLSYLPALEKAAEMCMRGEGCERDEHKVQSYLKEIGEAGHTEAFVLLGDYYVSGALGGTPNPRAAYEYYMRAATGGNPVACVAVGDRLVDGDGVDRDITEGLRWYDRAARLGSEVGALRAKELRAEGERLVKAGTEALSRGEADVALEAYTTSSKMGNTHAMCALGDLYLRGNGVKAAPKKAVELYEKASLHGDNAAKYRLANLILMNHGVKFNARRAEKLLTEALAAGHIPAGAKLDEMKKRRGKYVAERLYIISSVMYHRGQHAESAALRAKAARLGHARATFYLACMYDCGDGVPADRDRAAALYARAATLGFDGRATGYLSKYLHRLPR